MRIDRATKNQFKPLEEYERLPENTYRGPKFRWIEDPAMLALKIAIEMRVQAQNQGVWLDRNWRDAGVGPTALHRWAATIFPWYPSYYKARVGKYPTSKATYGRSYMQNYQNGIPKKDARLRAQIGQESFLRHPEWRDVVAEVERLLHKKCPISYAEMRRAGLLVITIVNPSLKNRLV